MSLNKYRRHGYVILATCAALAASWALARCSADLTPINAEDAAGGNGKACKNNAQCSQAEVCKDSVCVPSGSDQDGAVITCKSKVECGPGQDCVGGQCVGASGDAGLDGGAPDGETPNGDGTYCATNSSCSAGYRCNTETHACEASGMLAVDPPELDFGAVPYGSEVARPLRITNGGAATLRILSLDFDSGTNPDPGNPIFRKTASAPVPATLQPGEFLTVDVVLTQNDATPDMGALLITSTDPDKALTRVPMSSRYKGAPDLAIVDRNASPPDLRYPKSGDTDVYTIDLGNVALGGSKEVVTTITNVTQGDAILLLEDFKVHKKSVNEFTIVLRDTADPKKELTAPVYLSTGDMVDLAVKFSPVVKADAEVTDVDLPTNDDDINNDGTGGSNVLYLKLLAKAGWEPGGISVSKAQVAFGEVQRNTAAADVVQVCNSGGSSLSILPTSGLQTPQTAFSFNPPSLAKTLSPLECYDITVSFSPTKLGDAANALIINSDDPGNPSLTIAMTGTGTDPTVSIFPKTISFNNQFVGVAANPVNVVITNTGSGILTVTSIDLTAGSSGDFKVTNKPPQLPVTLHENQADSISFTVEFTATVNGVIKGAVQVENSDADNPHAIVDLTATADYATGHPCNASSECPSTFCVDNVCCNSKCEGLCERCDVAGLLGTCSGVTAGVDPDNECATEDQSTCGNTGSCSGTRGVCQLYQSGTVCQAASCAAGVLTNAKTCNGSGACQTPTPGTVNCAPYVCNGGAACYSACISGSDCMAGFACSAGGECKKAPGAICANGAECSTGFCVDGVCCNEGCGGLCEACTTAKKGTGADGLCGPITAGTDPDSECATDLPDTCGKTGFCSGNRGACQPYPVGTMCATQTCAAGLQTNAKTCNLAGICTAPVPAIIDCAPYICNLATQACYTTCATGTECATGFACAATVPPVCKKAKGQACGDNSECASGFCVDDVCCNEKCDLTCEGCSAAKKGGGADGTCGAIAAGTDPNSECPYEDASTCGKTGDCAGVRGSCQLYSSTTTCVAPSCSADLLTSYKADTCNGTGLCVDRGTQNCSPYTCNSTGGLCRTACAGAGDCAPGYSCSGGLCGKADGQICASPFECAHQNCIDGVCCNEACVGLCEACSAAKKGGGSDGICGAVTTGADPDTECAYAKAACDTGNCSGSRGACQKATSGNCVDQTCTADLNGINNADTCNVSGTCVDNGTQSCGAYKCNNSTGACRTTCAASGECQTGYTCTGGACKKVAGQACSVGTDCASTFCVEGVCCGEACGALCESCLASKTGGADGTCAAVTTGTDPDVECTYGKATCDSGNCSGSRGACQKTTSGNCVDQSCTADLNSINVADTCNGSGTCVDNGTTSCLPYKCNGATSACRSSCAVAGDCQTNYTCAATVCKKVAGQVCGAGSECASGFCTEGVCCNEACGAICESCLAAKTGGTTGTCAAVTAGSDPDVECAYSKANCDSGNCSGSRGACQKATSGTCVDQSCTADLNSIYIADTCNGAGACVDNGTQSCSPYKCNNATGACLTICGSSSDCQGGYTCSGGQCGKSNGQACTVGGECASTLCVESVCCNEACGALCESCLAAKTGGTTGTCAAVTSGSDPDGECAYSQANCDTGNCSGSRGACLKATSGTCVAQSCTGDLNSINNTDTCNGSGTCVDNGTTNCLPYKCAAGACKTSCTVAGDCQTNYTCAAGVCKKIDGQSCTAGTDCASTFCKDSVCCNNACGALCDACTAAKKGSGSDGTCGPVAVGTDPDVECPTDPVAGCQRNGSCSGSSGSCALYGSGTVCIAQSCTADLNSINVADTCNGSGACVDNGTTNCLPYKCAAGACKTSCTVAGDCQTNYTCAGGVCKKIDGQSCSSGSDCATGNCIDSVCCNTACGALCDACTAAKKGSGSDGACGPVAAGTDPDLECPTDPVAGCQRNGSCSGSSGSCLLYGSGTVCIAQSCTADLNSINVADTCNGSGTCVDNGTTNCLPYKCAAGACKTSCTVAGDCQTNYTCAAGVCKKVDGQSCSVAGDCASGNCKDSVCCNTACGALCEACTAAKKGTGSDGTCGPVGAGTDPDVECAYDKLTCKTGNCSGASGSCQNATSGTECVAQSCADANSINKPDTCNASGSCIDQGTQNCLPYVCAAGVCKTTCSITADCQTGYDCTGGVCKKIDGGSCTADGDCFHNKCCSLICRDISNDPDNCGACSTVCSSNNMATRTCGSSTCNGNCAANWTDCDANKQTNGCEKNLTNDPSNCGACSRVCGTTPGYIYPQTATYTCNASVCAVATCNANYYNFDAVTNANGCECGDLDTGNKACGSAVSMGTVSDAGQTVSITGNIPKTGDAVWYSVTASNPNWQQWGGANPFLPRVGFSSNPNNDFQLEVFSNCTGTYASCPEATKTIQQTRPTDMWEFFTNENPCYWSGALYPGEYQCLDHTSTYYIKVTRRTATNCSSFTVQATNNL